MMLLEIEHLHKTYHKKPVLQDLSFSLKENEIVGLLGPNGTGKSTLIRCICDLAVPDAGTITVDKAKVQGKTKSLVAYLPEKGSLNPAWKVSQAIDFFESFYPDFDASKARRLLAEFGLEENSRIRAMSTGMQEKLQIVLVMARRARLYLLDEPLGGVDVLSRDHILDTVLQNFEEGSSMIISTHLIGDLERILDRAVFLKDGRIVLDGPADSLREKYGRSIEEIYREVMKP